MGFFEWLASLFKKKPKPTSTTTTTTIQVEESYLKINDTGYLLINDKDKLIL